MSDRIPKKEDGSGRFLPGTSSPYRGLTYEERFGPERAQQIRTKMRLNHKGMSGRKHTPETVEKIRKGNTNPPAHIRRKNSLAKMGERNPMWGKTLTVDHRRKLSEASIRCGNRPPRQVREGHWNWGGGDHLRGEKSPHWKGGVTKAHDKIRKSAVYQHWREAVFSRDDYTCQICKERGGVLNADHIKPFSTHPELRLELTNGRTLCYTCHRATDTWGKKAKKPDNNDQINT